MKRMLVGFALVMLVCSMSGKVCVYAASFGPGDHWVDTCSGSVNSFSSVAVFGFDTTLDGTPELDLTLIGGPGTTTFQATSSLDDSSIFPGIRDYDGHLDVLDTEITSMTLTDGTYTMRAGTGAGVTLPSYGYIAEHMSDPSLAEHSWSLWLELDGTTWGTLKNNASAVLQAPSIDRIPPIGEYYYFSDSIPLFDQFGAHRANMTLLSDRSPSYYKPTPIPGAVWLLGSGLVGLLGLRKKLKK
jgi:hypothetical protein